MDKYQANRYLKSIIPEGSGILDVKDGSQTYKEFIEKDVFKTASIISELINDKKIRQTFSGFIPGIAKFGEEYIPDKTKCNEYVEMLILLTQEKEDSQKPFLTPEEEQAVVNYLEELYTTQEKFTQDEFLETISEQTNGKNKYTSVKRFLSLTETSTEIKLEDYIPHQVHGKEYRLQKK